MSRERAPRPPRERRTRALALAAGALALLVLVTLPVLHAQDPDPAPTELPWWGPEQGLDGWHLRVPVTVTNPGQHPLENAPVTADLDLQALALEAGWPAGNSGGSTFLKSFTLQPDSVRVVAYTNFRLPRTSPQDAQLVETAPELDGPERHTVPAQVRTGFLHATQERPYHATQNPLVSATWIVDGSLDPGQERSYVLYLDVEENGDLAPQDEARVQEATGALYWISRGTRIFGAGEEVTVTALHDATTVTVHGYTGLAPAPISPPSGQNPTELDQGQSATLGLAAQPQPFMVTADKPVVATGQVQGSTSASTSRDTGFLPSSDGTLRGTRFLATVNPGPYHIYTDDPLGVSGTLDGDPFSGSGPVHTIQVPGTTLDLETDKPVLVQGRPDLDKVQFADLETGAPVGDHLVGTPYGTWWSNQANRGSGGRIQEPGVLQLHALGEDAHLRGYTTQSPRERIVPVPSPGSTAQSQAVPAADTVTLQHRESWGFYPIELEAVSALDPGSRDTTARVIAIGGAPVDRYTHDPTPIASPLGGQRAQRFHATTPVHIFAFHDATQVTAANATSRLQLLDAGQRWAAHASEDDPLTITSDKPVAVIPQNNVAYGAGIPEGLAAQAHPMQVRGHLVALSTVDGQEEPLVKTTSFGTTVTYTLEATNLGTRADGSDLVDTLRFETGPERPGWNITLEPKSAELTTGERVELTLTVKTPETRNLGDRLQLPVKATSQANPRMSATVQTITLLQENREVGLWYQQIDGPQQQLVRLNPGQTRTLPLVVQNQGSTQDEVRLTQAGTTAGWTVRIQEDGEDVVTLPLDAKQARTLDLVLTAPAAGGVLLPASLTLTATSLNDTTAASKVLLDGVVLAQSKLELDTPENALTVSPGTTAVFQVHLANKGEAATDVQLNASASLPQGWGDPVITYRGESLDRLDNRITNFPVTGEEPIPLGLELTVPEDARGRLHAKILLSATPQGGTGDRPVTLPFHVLVEPLVHLDLPTAPTTTLRPGDTATLSLPITNTGNAEATLPVDPLGVPADWSLSHDRTLPVVPGNRTPLNLTLGVPAGTTPQNTTLELVLTLPNGTRQLLQLPVTVPPTRALELTPPQDPRLVPGVPTELTVQARNTGNRPTVLAADVTAPEGWQVDTRATPSLLDPLRTGALTLTLTPPREAGEGLTTLTLTPADAEGQALDQPPTELPVATRLPDLALQQARLDPGARDGDPPVARGLVVNHGNVAVENVTVAVVDGAGQALAQVTLTKVPTDSPRLFSLEVTGTDAVGSLAVRVDPQDTFPETDEQNNRAVLTSLSGTQGAPGPGLWAMLAAAGVAACMTRRQRGARG